MTRPRGSSRVVVAVTALAALAAALPVVIWTTLFPQYSRNRDEAVYVDVAAVLQDGCVTLPESHLPFRRRS